LQFRNATTVEIVRDPKAGMDLWLTFPDEVNDCDLLEDIGTA